MKTKEKDLVKAVDEHIAFHKKLEEHIIKLEQYITKQSDMTSDGFKSQDIRIAELEKKVERHEPHIKNLSKRVNSCYDITSDRNRDIENHVKKLEKRIEKLDIFANKEIGNTFENIIDKEIGNVFEYIIDIENELRSAKDRDVMLDVRIGQLEMQSNSSSEHDKLITELEKLISTFKLK